MNILKAMMARLVFFLLRTMEFLKLILLLLVRPRARMRLKFQRRTRFELRVTLFESEGELLKIRVHLIHLSGLQSLLKEI